MTLRDNVLVVKNNEFLNLKIEGDLKTIIDCYNKKSNIHSSIILLMKDTWKLSQDLIVCNYHHIYKKSNKTTNYLVSNIIVTHLSIEFIGILLQSLFS